MVLSLPNSEGCRPFLSALRSSVHSSLVTVCQHPDQARGVQTVGARCSWLSGSHFLRDVTKSTANIIILPAELVGSLVPLHRWASLRGDWFSLREAPTPQHTHPRVELLVPCRWVPASAHSSLSGTQQTQQLVPSAGPVPSPEPSTRHQLDPEVQAR